MNMKTLYFRCSTSSQDFDSQMTIIENYFAKMGISDNVHELPKIQDFAKKRDANIESKNIWKQLSKIPDNSYLYCSELSRLGCNMTDILKLIQRCEKSNITIVQCKDGSTIENKSIGGKAIIFALALASEIELSNIRQRSQAGVQNALKEGVKFGRSNENYGKGKDFEANKEKGNKERARNKNYNVLTNERTQAFCKVLSSRIALFHENRTPEPLFFTKWNELNYKLTATDADLIAIDIQEHYAMLWDGVTIDRRWVQLRYKAVMNTIKTFNDLNTNSNE